MAASKNTGNAKPTGRAASHILTDHDAIRQWAEQRGAKPARVKGTGEGHDDSGILRLDFGEPEERLEPIDWDTFFSIFDERALGLLVQEKTADGKQSRFNKLVARDDEA